MKLHSLKRKPKDQEEHKEEVCSPCGDYKEPDYPWGTKLCLDQESIAAMGLTFLPEAGSPISLSAVGIVALVSEESVEGGEKQQRLEIQITDLGLAMAERPMEDRMYPKK